LIIATRNLGRSLNTVAPGSEETRTVVHYSSAHAHALRHQLRGDTSACINRDSYIPAEIVDSIAQSPNPADAVLNECSKILHRLQQDPKAIDSIQANMVHRHLSEMAFVQGACERIKNTPVPFPYELLVHRTVTLYILLAPFAIAKASGWFTPLLMGIISYVFFGLDEVSHQLMNPFSGHSQTLPLEAMCRTIDISSAMALGDPPLENLLPVGSVLM
jgi:putative membrane protein